MYSLAIVPLSAFKPAMFTIMTDSSSMARDNQDVAISEARHMMATEHHKWISVYDPTGKAILALKR
jgi:hypothetical protein